MVTDHDEKKTVELLERLKVLKNTVVERRE